VLGTCQTHAIARADRLVADFVKARDRGCVVVWPGTKHGGGLQWSHLIRRNYHSTRWDPQASVAMCAAHHVWFTHHPLEFDEWTTFWLGPGAYSGLKYKALEGARPDLEQIITTYGGSA
jgi:hypothetical protein